MCEREGGRVVPAASPYRWARRSWVVPAVLVPCRKVGGRGCAPPINNAPACARPQELRTPGDEVISQLAACCTNLQALCLGGTAAHGTGLRRPAWAAVGGGPGGKGWLRRLRRLELGGLHLLRSSVGCFPSDPLHHSRLTDSGA